MKLSRELEGRKSLDEINFQRAGSGTVVRTYKYDPTKQKEAVAQKWSQIIIISLFTQGVVVF